MKRLLLITSAIGVSLLSLCVSGDSRHDPEPFGIAQDAVNRLFVWPLGIRNAKLLVSADPFRAECCAHGITIRVLAGSMHKSEVLRVEVVVTGARVEFLSATGPALENAAVSSKKRANIDAAAAFLKRVNGWIPINEPERRGARPGYVERRFRGPRPAFGESLGVFVVLFDNANGLVLLIGAPPPPASENCSGRP